MNNYKPGMFREHRMSVAEARIKECLETGKTELDLSDLIIRKLPDSISELKGLTSLDISDNGLDNLPDWIGDLKNLTALNIGFNTLSSLPEWMSELKNLTSLDISDNGLDNLPDWIGDLKNLTALNIGFNTLSSLPEWMSELKNLTSLDISGNGLDNLPDWIGDLKNLSALNVSLNDLDLLPHWISDLDSLTYLNIGGNKLRSIPEWISDLKKLAYLNLSESHLISLPEWIGNLRNLESLNLSDNYIDSLNDRFKNFNNLISLNISRNSLTSLPNWIGDLKKLEYLNFSVNPIKSLPDWIHDLHSLKSLSMRYVGSKLVPTRIDNLKNLEYLNISANKSEKMPIGIGELQNLKTLNISGNCFEFLPNEIKHCKNLVSLDLSDNRLDSLPSWLSDLKKLTSLSVRGNNLGIDTLYQTDPDTIFEALYYKGTQPLNEVRIVIVGEGQVGKSTLKNWIVDGKKGKTTQTTDIKIYPWQTTVKDKKINARIWDFGGQEIYQATHEFFLSDRAVYLLVVSARMTEEQNRVESWLRRIRASAPDSPIIIVTNVYERTMDIRKHEFAAKYRPIQFVDFYGETGDGLKDIKELINQALSEMEFIDLSIPTKWVELKDEVVRDERPYLTEQIYHALCKNRIESESAVESFRGVLNDLGLALSYRPRDRMVEKSNSSYYILDPDWIIQATYQVMNTDTSKTAKGVLTRSEIQQRLLALNNPKNPRYEPNDVDFLIGFMEDAHLAVRMKSEGDPSILVPNLSPPEPTPQAPWENPTSLYFHFDQVLDGLIIRLIISMYESGAEVWASGIERKVNGLQTRVELRTQPKQIWVTVNGRGDTARASLRWTRGMIERICEIKPYSNVPYSIYVPIVGHPEKSVKLVDLELAAREGISKIPSDGVWVNVQEHLGMLRPSNDTRPDPPPPSLTIF